MVKIINRKESIPICPCKVEKTNISHIIQNYYISRGTLINICSELNKEIAH